MAEKTVTRIVVLGKLGCRKCEAANQKLSMMGFAYSYVALDRPEGWRECDAKSALAQAIMAGIDHARELPILVIDETPFRYAAAMKELKARMQR